MAVTAFALLALAAPALDTEDGLHSAVLAPGDLNGDGTVDVVAAERTPAAKFGGQGSGGDTVWALSGADGSLLWSFGDEGALGCALAAAGDLDLDKICDIAVARAPEGSRSVLVLSGATGQVIRRVHAPLGVEDFGRSLAGGLDLTGDGAPDLLIGGRGQALIADGARGVVVSSVALIQEQRVGSVAGAMVTRAALRPVRSGADRKLSIEPPDPSSALGAGVAIVPDLDGDGRAEVAVGSDGAGFSRDLGVESIFVVASSDSSRSLVLPNPGWCMEVLDDVDGDGSRELATTYDSMYVKVFGLDDGGLVWRNDYLEGYMIGEGTSLAPLPDLNGDGAPELALGANETGLDCDMGFAAILCGRTGAELRPRLEPQKLDEAGQPAPWDKWCRSGLDVAALSDLDGDGAPELAVHVSMLAEVRAVSSADWSVRWRVELGKLQATSSSGNLRED